MEASPRSNVPTSSGKPSQKIGCCYSSKGGDQLHINAHDFGMRCLTSRCPHTFGHVVYLHMNTVLFFMCCYMLSRDLQLVISPPTAGLCPRQPPHLHLWTKWTDFHGSLSGRPSKSGRRVRPNSGLRANPSSSRPCPCSRVRI